MKNTRLLHAAYFCPLSEGRWGLPLFFEGQPGVAKSSRLRQFVASVGDHCEVLSGAERGDGAFGVIPVPDLARGIITYPAPDWTREVADGGLVFLDEITSNPPHIQAPCMGLMLDRRIGSHVLSPRVRVWAALNPTGIATNGYDVAIPLANRGGWLPWDPPSVDEHLAYMLGQASTGNEHTVDAKQEERRVEAEWPAAYARAIGIEAAFLRSFPEQKNRMPAAGDAAATRAWPSDRTWEMATRALATAAVHNLDEQTRNELVCAFVGMKTFELFFAFMRDLDMPNVGDLLDGKVRWTHNDARLDRTAAILQAGAALVAPEKAPNRAARVQALWVLLGKIGDSAMDLCVPTARALLNARCIAPAASTQLERMNRVLEAAGVHSGAIT